jgi:molybdopterin-guanine dinucleotide biosynthesis protein A
MFLNIKFVNLVEAQTTTDPSKLPIITKWNKQVLVIWCFYDKTTLDATTPAAQTVAEKISSLLATLDALNESLAAATSSLAAISSDLKAALSKNTTLDKNKTLRHD